VRELGSGGNGVAFLCQATETDSLVAKVYIPPDSRDLDERAYKRFKNEISLISKMQHPNVIKALGSGIIEIGAYSLPFYTMPFAPGTLRQEITTAGGPDHLERKLRIFLRAVLGVAALHSQGIVHRDLKPENILISDEGTPWVADLGIARVSAQLATTGVKTMASERLRNQDYYAPEQRFGSAIDVDHRADIYALGCILYELISGTPPVRVNSPKLQTISDSFSRLDSVIDRMTAFNAEDRNPFECVQTSL
jgi:serine/threonine-protein kinase